MDGSGGERKPVDGGPEVELIASGAAGEALVDVPLEIHGEVRGGAGRAVWQGAGAAELGTADPHRPEGEQFQDLAHGELGAEGRVVDRQEVGKRHG